MKREEIFRFPNKGPVSITAEDNDRTLVFRNLDKTALPASGFDAVVLFYAKESFFFRVEVAEPQFLAEKIQEHWWDRIVFSMDTLPQDSFQHFVLLNPLNDSVEGPFSVIPCVRDQELWLWCRRNP